MSANDELAGRMARMDAARAKPQRPSSILVEQGAGFRGVLASPNITGKLLVTQPLPAGIPWVPIADMPETWKDGREVLLWVPDGPREPHQFGRYAGAEAEGLDYWLTGENIPLRPTHVAAINPPEGA